MSSFAYCDHCEEPLRWPTLADAVVGSIRCPHCAEVGRDLRESERRMAVEDWIESAGTPEASQ